VKRRHVLIGIFVSFLFGVFFTSFFHGVYVCFWGICAFIIGKIVFSLFQEKREKKKWRHIYYQFSWIPLVFWGLFFCIGAIRTEICPKEPEKNDIGRYATDQGEEVILEGILSAFPDRRYSHEKWIFTAEQIQLFDRWEEVSGKVLLRIPRENTLMYGDKIQISGILKVPFESEEFSYKNYLMKENIFSVMSPYKIQHLHENTWDPLFSPLFLLRIWFDHELRKKIPSPESAFAAGILIGDRSGFSPELSEAFQKTGLSHLLALSGANITIIALAVFFVTTWLPKHIRIFVTLLFLFLFVLFVGGGASILRAAVMGGIGLFVVHSGRKADGGYLLLIASAIMVAFRPLILVYDPSFQLSIAGVLGLLAFSKSFDTFFKKYISSRFWREIIVATLAAELGVLPLIMFLFGEVPIISPLSNFFVVPLIPPAMLVSFLSVVLGVVFPFVGSFFAFISWNILHVGLSSIRFFGDVPYASIPFQVNELGFIFISTIVIVIFLLLKKT
jgi:competence protein ComEC